MKHTFLNLNEGSFPIKLDKKFKDLYSFEDLVMVIYSAKQNVSYDAG